MVRFTRLQLIFFLLFLQVAGAAHAESDMITYQERGNYWEGVADRKVSGVKYEILSFRVGNLLPPTLPSELTITFQHGICDSPDSNHTACSVAPVIQTLDRTEYYRLDRIDPSGHQWQPNRVCEFSWGTENVLEQLSPRPAADELGVLVRLDGLAARDNIRVAPVLLRDTAEGSVEVETYVLDIWAHRKATVSIGVGQEVSGTVTFDYPESLQKIKIRGNSQPKQIPIPFNDYGDGEYELLITIKLKNDTQEYYSRLAFNHVKNWE